MAMHNRQASGQQAAATAASETRDGHCLWPPPFAVVATQCSRTRFKRRTACAACSFEAELTKEGAQVLIATAAHFAAESSTGTNVNVCTTDDFTKSVDALVYYIDPEEEEMKTAYPNMLFDRNIYDGRAMMCAILTLTIRNNQGMGDVEYGMIYDFTRLFDGPSASLTCGAFPLKAT